MKIASRTFLESDQKRFAALSGDFNPIHMEATAARRSTFGRPVVHGVHLVLWAVDTVLHALPQENYYSSVSVSFTQPCLVGEVVALSWRAIQSGCAITAKVGSAVVAEVKLAIEPTPLGENFASNAGAVERAISVGGKPRDADFDQLDSNPEAFAPIKYEVASLFPDAVLSLGEPFVSGLVSLSTVVGMYFPGLYSIFSGFSANRVYSDHPVVEYYVVRRFTGVRQSLIRVRARGLDSMVRAAARPRPVFQPSFERISMDVPSQSFVGRRALIVGGSRGLGEATAKIIAAGGGVPQITYVDGRDDAQRVVDEIRSGGADCEMARFDVRESLVVRDSSFSSFYYFATSPIFRKKQTPMFNSQLFNEFVEVYVEGFSRLCAALRQDRSGLLRVFYPSSTALDRPVKELLEYSAAKSAGEVLCQHLNLASGHLRILCERLPRIMTDQTATVLPTHAEDATTVMKRIVMKVESL